MGSPYYLISVFSSCVLPISLPSTFSSLWGLIIAEKLDFWGLSALGTTIQSCIPDWLKSTSEGKNLQTINQPTICSSYKLSIVLNSGLLELHLKAQQQKENSVAIFRNIYKNF